MYCTYHGPGPTNGPRGLWPHRGQRSTIVEVDDARCQDVHGQEGRCKRFRRFQQPPFPATVQKI